MKTFWNIDAIPRSLAVLGSVAALLVLALPPEDTLGHIIKVVFVHGTLAQTGLLTFAAAGASGFAYLLTRRESVDAWCSAAQKTGIIVWSAYMLSSLMVTYLAWGIPLAWNEPRVRVSAILWAACLALGLLGGLAQSRIFSAMLNVILAVAAWGLVKSAGILRHPLNPIGSSDSLVFKIGYAALSVIMLLMALQLTRWLVLKAVPATA